MIVLGYTQKATSNTLSQGLMIHNVFLSCLSLRWIC